MTRIDLSSDPLAEMMKGVTVVFHAAAQPGLGETTRFEDYVRDNIVATQRLAHACMDTPDFRLFVNLSTSSVYGRCATESEDAAPQPASSYGVTKLASEQLVLAHWRAKRLAACSVRLFSVYGPRERPDKLYPRLIHSILSNEEFPLYEGSMEHSRSFTYIDDVVAGLLAVLDKMEACAGQIINLGSEIEITTRRGIEIVENLLGERARMKILPRRVGDLERTRANISKARDLLGYSPRTNTEDGLQREVDWYRQEVFGKINLFG